MIEELGASRSIEGVRRAGGAGARRGPGRVGSKAARA